MTRRMPQESSSLGSDGTQGQDGGDFLMRATELERSDKTSKVKVVTKKRIGSVGSSLFVVQVFYDIARPGSATTSWAFAVFLVFKLPDLPSFSGSGPFPALWLIGGVRVNCGIKYRMP